ncbi:hypothetical protein DNTS_006511, partial [Danionella cerebrum]
ISLSRPSVSPSLLCCKFIRGVKQKLARECAEGLEAFVRCPPAKPLQWTIITVSMDSKAWSIAGGPPLGPCIPDERLRGRCLALQSIFNRLF